MIVVMTSGSGRPSYHFNGNPARYDAAELAQHQTDF